MDLRGVPGDEMRDAGTAGKIGNEHHEVRRKGRKPGVQVVARSVPSVEEQERWSIAPHHTHENDASARQRVLTIRPTASSRPSMIASGRGGQPGMNTSTGKMLAAPSPEAYPVG